MAEIEKSAEESIIQQNFPVKRKRNLPGNPGKVLSFSLYDFFLSISVLLKVKMVIIICRSRSRSDSSIAENSYGDEPICL